MPDTQSCEHEFVYGGVKYEVDSSPLAGSGARMRHYSDWFFCKKCLHSTYHLLPAHDDTYCPVKFNATPK